MDAFYSTSSAYGAAASGWGYDSLKNFRQISPAVQSHLKLVYLTLCVALAASAVGAYLHVALNIGGMLTMLGCVGSIAWLFSVPVYEERKRFGILLAAALLEGASVGPLIKLAVDFDSSILVTAFVGTAIAFGCFTCAAIVAKRREYLYLGGLLSSGLSILLWLQFAASIFGHSTGSFMFEVYFGLLIFLGYMVYDTQEIIERAHHGDMDYIKHALTLFTDFVAVLVRILVIMLKNASDKSEEKKRKKRS
uniref:Bax inhibitor 1 n=1 Tax=Oryza meridionalis TaxID=40149 RepID=A0A0E0CES8_9ORYZ